MKWYSRSNYGRFKDDLRKVQGGDVDLTNHETVIKAYSYLPERIARKFPLSDSWCGRLNIEDLIQEGMIGLCVASKMIDEEMVSNCTNQELVIESFLSIRIEGAIKRAIINGRGTIRVPEGVSAKIKNNDQWIEDSVKTTYFFNVLSQLSDAETNSSRLVVDFNGELKEYNYSFVVAYVIGVLKSALSPIEFEVMKRWYGVDSPKMMLFQIASDLGDGLDSSKVFEIKKKAIEKISGQIDENKIKNFLR